MLTSPIFWYLRVINAVSETWKSIDILFANKLQVIFFFIFTLICSLLSFFFWTIDIFLTDF